MRTITKILITTLILGLMGSNLYSQTVAIPPIDRAITISEIKINGKSLIDDTTGTWSIDVMVSANNDSTSQDGTTSVRENYNLFCNVKVSRADVASALNISENDVREDISLNQYDQAIRNIAMSRVLASINALNE